jgi:hypothetical protein
MSNQKTNWKEMVGGRVLIKNVDVCHNGTSEVLVLEVSPKGSSVKFSTVESMPQIWWVNAEDFHVTEILPARAALCVMMECWQMVEAMRADEGNMVTLVCDNPDPHMGGVESKVIVSNEYTGWEDKEYTGLSVHHALTNAIKDFNKCRQEKKQR